jgi:hypothetical protein
MCDDAYQMREVGFGMQRGNKKGKKGQKAEPFAFFAPLAFFVSKSPFVLRPIP